MPAEVIRQTTITMPQWGGLEVPAIITADGVYFPVRYFCAVLLRGVDEKSQRSRIHRDPILHQLAETYPVQTAGGQQDMLCLERLGIGRWLDRIDPERMPPDIGPRILQFQWDLTYAAARLLWGEVPAGAPAPVVTIVPADRSLTRRAAAPMTVRDEDVRRYLLALAERVGHIEMSQREMRAVMLALASGAPEALPPARCPQCGYTFPGGEGEV